MSARVHSLDQPERLRGPFWTSMALHIGVVALFAGMTALHPFGKAIQLGDPGGGRFGSVAVNSVHSIPLLNRGDKPNPVANDTKSQVPQAPSKPKPQPKAKAPEPDAIPLKSRNARERETRQTAKANPWADKQQYRPNQVYSTTGQAASSPLYNMPGGGGVGFGSNSPFGTQFGWYANILRDRISNAWRTADLSSRTTGQVVCQFTLRRDGSLAPGLPRIVQTSGDSNVDRSAQRAILDAAPFPALPPGLGSGNEVTLELTFQLRR